MRIKALACKANYEINSNDACLYNLLVAGKLRVSTDAKRTLQKGQWSINIKRGNS